jgi:AraC-like DNA-binding protein
VFDATIVVVDAQRWQPFVYWSQHQHHAASGHLASVAQEHCYTLWSQADGTLRLTSPAGEIRLRPGQACLCDPGVTATWTGPVAFSRLAFDVEPRQRRRPVRWKPEWEQDPWTAQPPLATLPGPGLTGIFTAAEADEVRHLLDAVRITYWRSAGDHLWCCGLVGQWLLDLARCRHLKLFASRRARPGRGLADRADDLIRNQLSARLTAAEMARLLKVSREHLSRAYAATRGLPLKEALAVARLQEAQVLLQRGLAPQMVAFRCGYRTVEALHDACRRRLGCTPSELRRQHGL